jgi:hypothetical protein
MVVQAIPRGRSLGELGDRYGSGDDETAPAAQHARGWLYDRDVADSEQLAVLSDLHRGFESEGVAYWLFGGWAVDFHAGAQTRPHGDIDLAIWLCDFPRVAQMLEQAGWTREVGAQDGSAAFTRGEVSLELAFLERDDVDSEPYTPLLDGQRATWAAGAFGRDVLTLDGVCARVITLAALREENTGPRNHPEAAAKDRQDAAVLARLR